MKKFSIFYFILVFSFTFTVDGCKKTVSHQPANIVGQWKWLYTYYVYPLSDSNPKTPANTGITETIVFNNDKTWYRTQNAAKVDSGTYSTGHGSYLPYVGAYNYIYDSVRYYKPNVSQNMYDFYKVLHTDTLVFSSSFGGLLGESSKWWIKQ